MKSKTDETNFAFNLIFPLNNYKIHYEMTISVIFALIGYVSIAIYWHFSKDYDKMLSFTPIMIFGVLLGIVISWIFSVEIVSSSISPASKFVKLLFLS